MSGGMFNSPSLGTRIKSSHDQRLEKAVAAERERLENAYYKTDNEVCQELGKVLDYPWFKDDQKNFPGATEDDGVCVGEHVAVSIASEAANRIRRLEAKLARLKNQDEAAVAAERERCAKLCEGMAEALLGYDSHVVLKDLAETIRATGDSNGR